MWAWTGKTSRALSEQTQLSPFSIIELIAGAGNRVWMERTHCIWERLGAPLMIRLWWRSAAEGKNINRITWEMTTNIQSWKQCSQIPTCRFTTNYQGVGECTSLLKLIRGGVEWAAGFCILHNSRRKPLTLNHEFKISFGILFLLSKSSKVHTIDFNLTKWLMRHTFSTSFRLVEFFSLIPYLSKYLYSFLGEKSSHMKNVSKCLFWSGIWKHQK